MSWQGAPQDPTPWRWEQRRALLLAAARPGQRVLDLGCGAGRFSRALVEHGCEVVAVDPDPEAVRRARANAPGAQVREALDIARGSIDLVWCSEVIEHVAEPGELLHDVRRVLAPGGRLLLTTPAHGLFRRVAIAALRFDRHFDPRGDHLRFFTERTLRESLEAAQLAPSSIRTVFRRSTLLAEARR